ncbi:unnamed protein product [Heligmosomoides polygyrus]|uniref:Calcineurin-like phosphoesterase domain-containing protein n=1 Tax=Heligmosomoides polygyrus TaxID=6339 RepID=A0A3P7YGE0_HELPZ|nr:unnamed protein product [Heligmosomoides polygyrus]
MLTLLWGESASYLWCRLRWRVPHPVSTATNSLGILIVADPQLVGFKNENHMAGPLTRWDSDRFLSKGFSQALSATNPDLIVFLGDLFDEGLEANDAELEWTLSRFNAIFESNIPKIFISGDNDVGGEGEPVQSLLTTRFGQLFSNSFPSSNTIFDLLSFTEVATLAPDLILSAHDHKASIYHLSRGGGGRVNYTDLTAANDIRKETVGGDRPILELQTPTCSYRCSDVPIQIQNAVDDAF